MNLLRARTTWVICLTALTFITACSDDPAPPCGSDAACQAGQVCRSGLCVDPEIFTCEAAAACDQALADGLWVPDNVAAASDCRAITCAEGLCALALKAEGSACADGDDLSCTLGACSAVGACEDAGVAADACLIDGACQPSGAKLASSDGCQVCEPSANQGAWTTLDDGATCEKDGESCRPGTCASGVCEFKAILPGFCHLPGTDGGACVQDGAIRASTGCEVCDAGNAPTSWSALPSGASCTDDDSVACTVGVCDGSGQCDATPDDTLCSPSGPCTGAVCDPTKGCLTPNLPKEATCSGSDGVACTVEYCDGNGACDNTPTADDSLCDDGVGCTLDSCDGKQGCVNTPQDKPCDDGNVCTDDSCDANSGCTYSDNTSP